MVDNLFLKAMKFVYEKYGEMHHAIVEPEHYYTIRHTDEFGYSFGSTKTFYEYMSDYPEEGWRSEDIHMLGRVANNPKPNEKILYIGVGAGRWVNVLTNRFGLDVVGIDNNPDAVALAKARGAIKTELGDGENLTHTSGTFDTVILDLSMWEFGSDISLRKILNSANRVLKQGGRVLVDGYYLLTDPMRPVNFVERVEWQGQVEEINERRYRPELVLAFFEQHGFQRKFLFKNAGVLSEENDNIVRACRYWVEVQKL